MRALPESVPAAPAEEITGLSCPECFGVLNAQTEGPNATLSFRCRVGHRYGADDVVGAKERWIEDHLWAAVTALAELQTFLRELVGSGRAGAQAAALEQRVARAGDDERALRRILETKEPLGIEPGSSVDQGLRSSE